jgi:hypothetical protein
MLSLVNPAGLDRSIEIIFSRDPDQGEEGIPPGIRQRRSHPIWCNHLADGTYGPIGRDWFGSLPSSPMPGRVDFAAVERARYRPQDTQTSRRRGQRRELERHADAANMFSATAVGVAAMDDLRHRDVEAIGAGDAHAISPPKKPALNDTAEGGRSALTARHRGQCRDGCRHRQRVDPAFGGH